MRFSAIQVVVITSLLLLLVTILAVMNFSFGWVFYITCLGQLMVIIMVYKVLTDKYSTDKTFDDFYEDHTLENE